MACIVDVGYNPLSQEGVPVFTVGSPYSREYGDPGVPIFTGCVYFYDTGF